MGLLCSKSNKTADGSPEAILQKNNNIIEEKRPAEVEEAQPSARPSPRAQTPLPPDGNPPAAADGQPAAGEPPEDGGNAEGGGDFGQPAPVTSPSRSPAINDELLNGCRIAVIGANEAGKSTVVRQMAIFCKQSPHEIELLHRPIYIRDFLFRVMQQLLQHMRATGDSLHEPENTKYAELVDRIGDRRGRPLVNNEVEALVSLWEDEAIQEAYSRRGEINLNDSVMYFFGCLDRIADIDYVPSQEDLLHLYIPSVGVAQYAFAVGSQDYLVYDVSGRMVERQRWTVHYDHFDALIFTLAISEFDQFYEDERGKHNRFKHGLELLKEVASDARFKDTLLFVFLNETDIFKEKLIRNNLQDFLSAFNGNSEKDALSFMKQLAVDACAEHSEKLHLFFTTAVNTRKMHKVLNEVFKKVSKSKE